MTLRKIAKSIARKTGEDVEEVYQRFIKNRKKVRRMEGRIDVEDYQRRGEYHNPKSLDKLKRVSKAQSRSRR